MTEKDIKREFLRWLKIEKNTAAMFIYSYTKLACCSIETNNQLKIFQQSLYRIIQSKNERCLRDNLFDLLGCSLPISENTNSLKYKYENGDYGYHMYIQWKKYVIKNFDEIKKRIGWENNE